MFDFMALELFDESLGCLDDGTYHPWVDMLFGSIKAWAFLSLSEYFPALFWIITPAVRILRRDLLRHRNTKFASIASKVSGKREPEPGRRTFDTYIQESKNPQSSLFIEEILPNYSFIMMAGSETTATLLSGCTFFILRHPDVYKKLAAEIRLGFSSPSEMTFSSLVGMSYLQATLQEALRMYPPLPLGMPRVVPSGGAVVSGHLVPENTTVAVASWATYQSSSNFKDPQLFFPERWLNTFRGTDNIEGAMQAFSLGPRGCPGKSLALAEASLVLARLIWTFDLELSPQCFNWADQRAYIIWDKGPLLVKLTPRR
ncbi:unnamed protein product [Penicillium egyptiacum]|uniref:Cytochrome P450 n=1 Tax=Penicillium egyptiacum TaxID=1303716 RepID=A0A9W4K8P4_9EURO|nr:unnamed protein product [Penicillium egyptiacum]